MADSKKFAISKAERKKDDDLGVNYLRIWLRLDDGTTDYVEYTDSSSPALSDITDATALETALGIRHTGGPNAAATSYAIDGITPF